MTLVVVVTALRIRLKATVEAAEAAVIDTWAIFILKFVFPINW